MQSRAGGREGGVGWKAIAYYLEPKSSNKQKLQTIYFLFGPTEKVTNYLYEKEILKKKWLLKNVINILWEISPSYECSL